MNRRFNPVSVEQAAQDSPALGHLVTRVRETQSRWHAIEELISPELRVAVHAGPVADGTWCLLVQGSAAAAKLRQLAPTLLARLQREGWPDTAIRIKVRGRG